MGGEGGRRNMRRRPKKPSLNSVIKIKNAINIDSFLFILNLLQECL